MFVLLFCSKSSFSFSAFLLVSFIFFSLSNSDFDRLPVMGRVRHRRLHVAGGSSCAIGYSVLPKACPWYPLLFLVFLICSP